MTTETTAQVEKLKACIEAEISGLGSMIEAIDGIICEYGGQPEPKPAKRVKRKYTRKAKPVSKEEPKKKAVKPKPVRVKEQKPAKPEPSADEAQVEKRFNRLNRDELDSESKKNLEKSQAYLDGLKNIQEEKAAENLAEDLKIAAVVES